LRFRRHSAGRTVQEKDFAVKQFLIIWIVQLIIDGRFAARVFALLTIQPKRMSG